MMPSFRSTVQLCVDWVRNDMGFPNHGTGRRCLARLSKDCRTVWVRVHERIDPDDFRARLAKLLEQTYPVEVRLNGTKRYVRIQERRHEPAETENKERNNEQR